MPLSCTVSVIQRDIGQKSPIWTYLTSFWCPHWNFTAIFGTGKLESLGHRMQLFVWS